MATIQFQIKDEKQTEAENAVAALNNFTGFLADGTTPQTKTQFLRQWLKGQVRNQMTEYRNRQAIETAMLQDTEI